MPPISWTAQARSPRAQARGPKAQARGPKAQAPSPRAQARSPKAQARLPKAQARVWRALVPAAVALVLAAGTAPVRADIYTYQDKDGVTHFTNIKPRSRKYKRLYKTGPGKASGRRCKGCDVIPARDSSPDRYTRYDTFIRGASRLYQIPEALIRAVMETESDYDPRVVSSAGAKGLMQLMPQTARHMGVTEVFDPRQNIYGGVRYLRVLANTFNGNLILTLAGYHAGPGAVAKYRGIPPYEITHRYVRVVIKRYYKYRKQAMQGSSGAARQAAVGAPHGSAAASVPPPPRASRAVTD